MRVNLCALMLSSYDVLILDEPTNHLDMVTKECLINALKTYEGAIIFISHDRYFINELATYTLFLSKDKVLFNEGSYDDLKELLDNSSNNNELITPKLSKKEDLIFDKQEVKPKLSNNKIQEIKKRMKDIEEEVDGINLLLNEDFEDYKKIEELQDQKDTLENEYFELMNELGD